MDNKRLGFSKDNANLFANPSTSRGTKPKVTCPGCGKSYRTVKIQHDFSVVENYFRQLYKTPNHKTLDVYEHITNKEPNEFEIKLCDVEFAI